MILNFFSKPQERQAQLLYKAIVAAARQPRFYTHFGVEDTVDGRFEMVVLHMFLVLHRLQPEKQEKLTQRLTDVFFLDLDHNIRELGVSDVAVGKKLRKLEERYLGRLLAYKTALESGDDHELVESLTRNLYGKDALAAQTQVSTIQNMASYVRQAEKYLKNLTLSMLISPEVQLYETHHS